MIACKHPDGVQEKKKEDKTMRTENLFISVLEASKATGFPIRKWIQWILRGLIPSEPKLNADHLKGIPYASIAPNIVVVPLT